MTAFELKVLRTPVRAPRANAYCERLVGKIRRECLDFVIPFGEKHLRKILRDWVAHYNYGRPHLVLGPSILRSRWITANPLHGTDVGTSCPNQRGSQLAQSWADYTTNTGSKELPHRHVEAVVASGLQRIRGHLWVRGLDEQHGPCVEELPLKTWFEIPEDIRAFSYPSGRTFIHGSNLCAAQGVVGSKSYRIYCIFKRGYLEHKRNSIIAWELKYA